MLFLLSAVLWGLQNTDCRIGWCFFLSVYSIIICNGMCITSISFNEFFIIIYKNQK